MTRSPPTRRRPNRLGQVRQWPNQRRHTEGEPIDTDPKHVVLGAVLGHSLLAIGRPQLELPPSVVTSTIGPTLPGCRRGKFTFSTRYVVEPAKYSEQVMRFGSLVVSRIGGMRSALIAALWRTLEQPTTDRDRLRDECHHGGVGLCAISAYGPAIEAISSSRYPQQG